MPLRLRAALTVAVALLATPRMSLAQDTWIVLPVGIGEEPAADVQNFVAVSAAGIETRGGTTVLQGPVLRHRLENTVSLPYEEGDASALAAQLAEADDELVRELARQRYDEVIGRAGELIEQATESSLALQRDAEASLHLGRVCAYLTARAPPAGGRRPCRRGRRLLLCARAGHLPRRACHPSRSRAVRARGPRAPDAARQRVSR